VVLGILIIPASIGLVLWKSLATTDQGVQFAAPGSVTVDIGRSGTWVLFHETEGTFEGALHRSDASALRGIDLSVVYVPDGSRVLVKNDSSTTMETMSSRRESVARFEADRVGAYTISASGNAGPVVLYAGRDMLATMLVLILGSCGVNVVAIGLIGVGIWMIVRGASKASAPG
jgi:hypothetical protein